MQTDTLLKHPDVCPVIDSDGDPLIRDQIYQKQDGSKFRVTDWRFGAGNIMNSYYWVFGINQDLKNDRLTIEAKHRRNQAKLYQSPLAKTFRIESCSPEIRTIILTRRLNTVRLQEKRTE